MKIAFVNILETIIVQVCVIIVCVLNSGHFSESLQLDVTIANRK